VTFKELQRKIGPQPQADWHQAKGGGWLHKSAKVDNENHIKENAIVWGAVFGNAQVFGDARVSGNAWVFGDARVSGNARVFGDARVSGNAWVFGDARVSGNARVFGDAWVSGNARVSGDAWETSPIFIIGSRLSLTNSKHGHIQIGCECHPFEWWTGTEARALAKAHNFTQSEISEYEAYIELFKKIGK
jgi:hypothetical protein